MNQAGEERRLKPQITVGLLTDPPGFPLMVQVLEGKKAENATIPGTGIVAGARDSCEGSCPSDRPPVCIVT